jgi:aspartate aminotransferase-like enzyme
MSSYRSPATIDAQHYATIEQRFGQLLDAPNLFLQQGEAIISLEAVARSVGRPGSRALNIVTGPYGEVFGNWLAQQGVIVETLSVPFNRAVRAEEVDAALSREDRFDLVSVVHAEAATGVVNDLKAIAALARRAGAITVVDAVASVGAEQLDIEAWGLDVTVLSTQKALSGPAGVTGLVISDVGWAGIAANPAAPRDSVLSLLDWREHWLDSDRAALPTIPNHLETWALDAALSNAADEGLTRVIARHTAARDACRRGIRALGLDLWVESDESAAAVATTVAVPDGIVVTELVDAARRAAHAGLSPALSVAPGPLRKQALRVGHTGQRATTADVLATVAALGLALRELGLDCDLDAALAAVLAG